jgi:hypothetical protein
MKKQLILFLLSFLITHLLLGQTDPNNIPKPPIEKLKIFEPYFGNYKHTMNYAGMDWSGTMEIKPIIKGWYVDWTILTKSADNKIDREYHMLVTYDTAMNKYRIWRFETMPPNNNEISLSTDGTDIIIEMKVQGPNGRQGIFYNRYSKPTTDEIKVVTELRSTEGKVLQPIGVTTATRIK